MRKDDRVTINKEFESFDAFVGDYVSNISRSGVFIRSSRALRVGTKVNLRFTVLMDDVEIIEGIGRVVRVVDEPPGMGLTFLELSESSREVLDRLFPAADSPGRPSGLELAPDGSPVRGG